MGALYPEEIVNGSLEDEAAVDMDVCIYTEDKRWRPWLGGIVKLLENTRFVAVHPHDTGHLLHHGSARDP